MLLSKATLLALLPFFVQVFANPSVKRQDDDGSDGSNDSSDDGTAALYDQCGGIGFDGYTTCEQGSSCQYSNDYYSQCLSDKATKRQDDDGSDNSSDDSSDDGTAALYDQCGGIGFDGYTTCEQGSSCQYSNDYYSQCLSDKATKRQDDGSGDDTTDDNSTDDGTDTTDDNSTDDGTDTTGDNSTDNGTDIPDNSNDGQAAQYAQCGGISFSGPTSCVSPYTCRYSNDYYSQCL